MSVLWKTGTGTGSLGLLLLLYYQCPASLAVKQIEPTVTLPSAHSLLAAEL